MIPLFQLKLLIEKEILNYLTGLAGEAPKSKRYPLFFGQEMAGFLQGFQVASDEAALASRCQVREVVRLDFLDIRVLTKSLAFV